MSFHDEIPAGARGARRHRIRINASVNTNLIRPGRAVRAHVEYVLREAVVPRPRPSVKTRVLTNAKRCLREVSFVRTRARPGHVHFLHRD